VDFNLYLFSNNDGVYGVVNYIAPNSDASTKDIQRGDIFTGVNGQALNLDNYQDLLFGEDATYTLNLAEIRDNTISDTGEEVSLTKVENFAENPILVNKVLEQNGIKIGYLMYNSFVADYDDELNQVFGDFEAQGVSELILDFRYNGGGRVSSAIQIASSVYGTNTDELFLKARYNDKIQSTFDPGDGENNFTDETFDSGTMLNSLNLNRVYVIATESTASASELVMNGLEPYIDVVHVGTRTVGKNEFSNTFVDDPAASYFYREDREGFINPDNQWAIQPLLGRNENADGFSDYTSGLVPDYELPEDIANLGVLGEDSDPLLDLTLSVISGATAKRSFEPEFVGEYLTSSYMFKPMGNNMSMNGLLKPVLTSD
jgi:C-terminal processing protease CtpA/Prc